MTVNWERESGEKIEEFVAAYLLLKAGAGNQIRPAQGDQGVDVVIPTATGLQVFQVKRFSSNLGPSEKRQIRESWERFVTDFVPHNKVSSWSLVMPLEPTPPNVTWLKELTADAGFDTRWIGRAILDGWASDAPRLTDFYFGDGGMRWHELMAQALSAGRSVTSEEGDPLLGAVQERMRVLSASLDEVDPFYRYEIEVRSGSLDDLSPHESLRSGSRPGLVESVIESLDERHYLVTHVFARSPVSTQLRPVRGTFRFTASTPEDQQALERFFLYGAPLLDANAVVEASEGPPGTVLEEGGAASAWTVTPAGGDDIPDLEVRLVKDETVVMAVPVVAATRSGSPAGPGEWFRAELSGAAAFEFFLGAPGRPDRILLSTNLGAGASPSSIIRGIELVADLPGASVELAIRDGLAISPRFEFGPSDITTAARGYAPFLQALLVVQQHSYDQIVVPEFARMTEEEGKELVRVQALLQGSTVSGRFAEFVIDDAEFFADWDDTARALIQERPLVVRIGGLEWRTVMVERTEFESVRVVRSDGKMLVRPGASDRMQAVAVRVS
ncbi:restriction endonuclease [Microbacterium oxydans]|uniref:restriction endonuclease n=1 Tax=Microbacterium sp. B19(2022) TaxID=2914045 RepID=UPI00142FCE17|nr:restriction endonuclease [Microbacterium sp. B19(2022)]NJI58604.1 restriction endonuclease [Microbacterium sp. B19(2022)]